MNYTDTYDTIEPSPEWRIWQAREEQAYEKFRQENRHLERLIRAIIKAELNKPASEQWIP